jgi:hypothetical protein
MAAKQLTDWAWCGTLAEREAEAFLAPRSAGQTARIYWQTDSAGEGKGAYLDDGAAGAWVKIAELGTGMGGGITALTGDVTATWPGSATATITNGAVTDAKIAAGVDAAKIGGGSVSNTEFSYLDGVTGALQGQLDNKQPLDPELSAIAGLSSAADKVPYFTGVGTAALATLTAFARTLLDDADADAGRITLGLGAIALLNSIATANLDNNAVTDAKLRDSAALSVIGRSANSSGDPADIAAASNNQFLGRRGDVVGFYTLNATDLSIVREKLTAARTYYVRTDGSDSNTGLTNTAGGAFLTIQKAIDVVQALDLGGFTATIQVGNGTYTGSNTLKNLFGGSCIIQGDTTTPSNVLISPTSGPCFTTGLNQAVINYRLQGFKLQTNSAGSHCIYTDLAAQIQLGKLDFGAANAGNEGHLFVITGSKVTFLDNYTISGDAFYHWYCLDQGLVQCISKTITLSGTRAFNTFAVAIRNSTIWVASNTFSGSATGQRYNVQTCSVIETGAAGANYLPGNTAGSATLNGIYN